MWANILESMGVSCGSTDRRRKAALATAPAEIQVLENREVMSASTIHYWNDILLDTIRDQKPAPPMASRAMAMVSTAVFDAVNSIDGRYESYQTTAFVPSTRLISLSSGRGHLEPQRPPANGT